MLLLCRESDNESHVVIGRRTSPISNSVSPVVHNQFFFVFCFGNEQSLIKMLESSNVRAAAARCLPIRVCTLPLWYRWNHSERFSCLLLNQNENVSLKLGHVESLKSCFETINFKLN